MIDQTNASQTPKSNWKTRIKQMGMAAFLFFFIKGLIWLAIFFGLGSWLKNIA